MKTKLTLTISRRNSRDKNEIAIRIRDTTSRICFLDAKISLENFAEALTGLAERDMDGDLYDLEFIGKLKITEQRSVECPLTTSDKQRLRKWIDENCQEPGWIVESYLGSKSAVVFKNEKRMLTYSVYKYVDPT